MLLQQTPGFESHRPGCLYMCDSIGFAQNCLGPSPALVLASSRGGPRDPDRFVGRRGPRRPRARGDGGAALSPAGAASRNTYPIAGVPLLVVGMLVALVSSINFLVGAFRVGLGWGLGCLFLWPVGFAFLVLHWRVAKRPFFVSLAGLAAALVGYALLGAGT